MAHDVFISYSTKDKIIADAVCAKLEENKIRVWIAPRDVPPGSNFAASIIKAINSCNVFVLIWSAVTNESEHIMNEINQAFDRGIIIIPFRIQDIQPTDEMRYYFGRTHWLDAIDPPLEDHISKLRDIILVNLGREPQPSTPTPLPEESAKERLEPPDEPSAMKEPGFEKAEVVKHQAKASRQKKIEARARAFKRSKALPANLTRFIPYAAGGLAVITLVILLVSGVFKGSPPAGTAPASPSPASRITPASAINPTATFTPIPDWLEEVNTLAEPILAAVNNHPPDFADDFSHVDTAWIYPPGQTGECFNEGDFQMNISDGSMKYSIINCQVGNLQYPDMQYTNYVIQVDVNFLNQPLGLEFRNWSNSPLDRGVQMGYFLQSPEGYWGFEVLENGKSIEIIDGNTSLDFSKPVTVTIIKKSPTFIVYINSIPVTYYITQEEYAGPFLLDFTVNSWDVTPTETLTLELDNFKVWDLDKIEETIAFSESILAVVQDLPPDFEDDFSQVDPAWMYYPAKDEIGCNEIDESIMSITDGTMKPSLVNCRVSVLIHPDMNYSNYVLQLDVNFQQSILGLEFRMWNTSVIGNSTLLAFWLQAHSDSWGFQAIEIEDVIESLNGNISLDNSKPITVTIINNNPTFIVYVDSSPVMTYHTPPGYYEGQFTIDFTINSWQTTLVEPETLELDNVKVWDLDNIEY